MIDGSDRTLRAALELMRGHSKNVVEHRQADEKRVFVALVSSNDTVSFGLWPCHHIHERFIEFHKLFKFTREQLRNQNAGLVFLKREDVHEVQGRLGHASLKTTSGYVRQHIISVLNRANIAEFVRRLGASSYPEEKATVTSLLAALEKLRSATIKRLDPKAALRDAEGQVLIERQLRAGALLGYRAARQQVRVLAASLADEQRAHRESIAHLSEQLEKAHRDVAALSAEVAALTATIRKVKPIRAVG